MENNEYNNLVIQNDLDKLANITNISDLIRYSYLNRYLIEYLLEKNIHTTNMDNLTFYNAEWANFYLKYNVLTPLLKCHLRTLLVSFNNKSLLEMLLAKLSDEEKLVLYHNLKENSYWDFKIHEKEIINLYSQYGIELPQIFIENRSLGDSKTPLLKHNIPLINEFKEAFKSLDSITLELVVNELKKRLLVNKERTRDDIRKLIDYKKKNKDFNFVISAKNEGEYNGDSYTITINKYRSGIITHEVSHLMYDVIDPIQDINDLTEYEAIRLKIDTPIIRTKIISYLTEFHERYNFMKNIFKELYFYEIKKKYHSLDNYKKTIYQDIITNHPEIISIYDDAYIYFIDSENVSSMVDEILGIEQEEFVDNNIRNYYTEELMLENLLDALLNGKICDLLMGIDCLSGHFGFNFIEDEELSFNECLADYDMIANSLKAHKLLSDLENLVGKELINFLDYYLEKNRGKRHGI